METTIKGNGFSRIDNSIIFSSLPTSACGLAMKCIYLMNIPGYEFLKSSLRHIMAEGTHALNNAWRELKDSKIIQSTVYKAPGYIIKKDPDKKVLRDIYKYKYAMNLDLHPIANYTEVSNHVLTNKKLHVGSVLLYGLIKALITRKEFRIIKSDIRKRFGREGFKRAWHELKEHGYLKVVGMHCKGVRGFVFGYELLDIPDTDRPSFVQLLKDKTQTATQAVKKIMLDITDKIRSSGKENKPYHRKQPAITPELLPEDVNYMRLRIKQNIAYEHFIERQRWYREMGLDVITWLPQIYEIIIDVLYSNTPTHRISNSDVPALLVKSRLLELRSDHIHNAIIDLTEYDRPIINPKAFIIAVLYNSYYEA